jgi:hypothetical protein
VVELGGAGQPLQVASGELVQHAGDLGLGHVPQQQDDQFPRLGVALLQPGAPSVPPGQSLDGRRMTRDCQPSRQGKDQIGSEPGRLWRPWQDSNLQPAV